MASIQKIHKTRIDELGLVRKEMAKLVIELETSNDSQKDIMAYMNGPKLAMCLKELVRKLYELNSQLAPDSLEEQLLIQALSQVDETIGAIDNYSE